MSKHRFYAWSYEYQASDGSFVRIVYGFDTQPSDESAARAAAAMAWQAAKIDAQKHNRVVRLPRFRIVREHDMQE